MEARYMTDLEWRICHAVNIYVFRNGNDVQSPALVHIPPARKKNMMTVMNTVQERIKYPVGYAKTLYTMEGRKIRHPCELEMYNNYVVASNMEKHFKCVEYGRRRSPLLILNRDSKHIRVLRLQNENYDRWLRKKQNSGSEHPQYVYPERYIHEGLLPQDLPVDRMGNTYVDICDDYPKNTKPSHMTGVQNKISHNQNYTVALVTNQDPLIEYLQNIEPTKDKDINNNDIKTNVKKLAKDEVFYQPKTKWKTKGVIDTSKNKQRPLFARPSDVVNSNTIEHMEPIDVAVADEDVFHQNDLDECHDVVEGDHESHNSFTDRTKHNDSRDRKNLHEKFVGQPYKIIRTTNRNLTREQGTQTQNAHKCQNSKAEM